MFCKNCGSVINASQKFCPKCGKNITYCNNNESKNNGLDINKKFPITAQGKAVGYTLCAIGFIYLICISVAIGLNDALNNAYIIFCLAGIYLIIMGAYIPRRFVYIADSKVIINSGAIFSKTVEIKYDEILNAAVSNSSIFIETIHGKIKLNSIANATECCNLIIKNIQEK